jgi:hypothetical protein
LATSSFWRQLPPEGLADEDDSSGAQARRQKLDRAADSPGDPGGTDTGCHTDLLVRDLAGGIAMDKPDLIGDAEFHGTEFRLPGEQQALVDAGADDSAMAGSGVQNLPRTAAEVKHSGPRFQRHRRAESGELFWRERVMDAVSTFGDVENPWDVHLENLLSGVNRFGQESNAEPW